MKTPDETVTKSSLSKYTKEELIDILCQLAFHVDPFQNAGHLKRAIGDVEYERQMARIDKAHDHAERAFKARNEAFELLQPYEGKKYSDIPNNVRTKIAACIRRAEREEAAWEKLSKEIDSYNENT